MLEKLISKYSSLSAFAQMNCLMIICNLPTLFVYLLIKIIKFDSWKYRKLIIRLGIAFSLGAMLGDFVFHISIETFGQILGTDKHKIQENSDEQSCDHSHDHHHHHHHPQIE